MDPDRWHRINELFHRAVECDLDGRARFLDDACGDDPSIRVEVDSLLTHHDDQATDLIRTPPETAADVNEGAAADSLVGREIGQCTVTRLLGEGGMGVVYLAEDSRLGRSVAVKALAREFTRDDQRRRRLRREARAAAALSHPGIATVYALEEFDDNLYIVSEYVRGDTLRKELANGPLPPGAVLNTAVEIARALTAAHEHHVVHRDLKPENVIRTLDGGIKILDFGLARFKGPQLGPGASTTRLTEPGAVLGTPGYMAPEQIRGADVDFRADIFAFGVLLFELTSGLHPFTGVGQGSTLARVLEVEAPDLARLTPSCPSALERIIRQCLQKNRDQRYGATRELLDELEQVRRDLAESGARSQSAGAAVAWTLPRGCQGRARCGGGSFIRALWDCCTTQCCIRCGRCGGGCRRPWGHTCSVPLRDRCSFGRFPWLISQALSVTYMAGERRLYLERNCRLPESPAHSRRRNREGPASSKGLNSQRGFGPAVEPRRKSRPRSTSLYGSSPCKCQRLSTLRWDRLPPSRPSTKSGARAGGRRLSDRRLHRWLAGTSASAPSSHGAADLLGLNRAHICVRNHLFFATLIAVGVAGSLRFHLWFTQRFNPAEIRAQRAQVFPWVRGADCLFVLVLLWATAAILVEHAVWATVIGSIAIGSFLSFLIFEPATTRAAFRRSRTRSTRPRKTGTSKTLGASQSE